MIRYITTKSADFWRGKVCLVRIDLNITPLEVKKSPFRLTASLPTIQFLHKAGATIVLISHSGRPQGVQEELSVKSLLRPLEEHLKTKVNFIPYSTMKEVRAQIGAKKSTIYLLENIRFWKGEEKNSMQFARELASLGEIYVNDAFAVSHRENASVCAITKHIPSYGGLLLHREIDALYNVMHHSEHPCTIILGGAKVKDKIGVIKYFWKKADHFLLGGGPANTFCAVLGMDVRNSLIDKKVIPEIKKFLHDPKIELPIDFKIEGGKILDIGEKTSRAYSHIIASSATIIWNGPMGFFERKEFMNGTRMMWEAILAKKQNTHVIVGGGETVTSLHMFLGEKASTRSGPRSDGKRDTFGRKIPQHIFLSTGGGAMLEYLSGKKLPGIEALK